MRCTRVTLFFITLIIALGFYQLARHFLAEVEPQTYQATEEVMVDISNILAELIANDITKGELDAAELRNAFASAHRRQLHAKIFSHLKTQVGIHFYVTDAAGKVIFDSDDGHREGLDYARKRDVALTLSGRYGARSSREDPDNHSSSVLYVAAPIGQALNPSGVLTVYKSQADMRSVVQSRRRIIYVACGLIGSGILFLITAVFLWLFHPLGKITEYARAIERGERPKKPKIGIGREVNTLAHALDSMRDALEGRRYAERYIQTLTHEMKSPLAAIHGAAELLREEMPATDRKRFLENILAETARSERLINFLLELAAIEGKKNLDTAEVLDFQTILARAIEEARPRAELAGIQFHFHGTTTAILLRGDSFILRAAISNLLENGIDFSPPGSSIEIGLQTSATQMELTLRDHGPGIPEYAKERVFERFYSLRHHTVGRKGTGLGLTLVREAAELHGGSITLEAADGGGTIAQFTLPISYPKSPK